MFLTVVRVFYCLGIFISLMRLLFRHQITLPPLIEDVEDRKLLADGIRRSRSRYRRFRSRLSEEISQSSGESFPTSTRERFVPLELFV